jgi:hypothetical protein
MADNPDGKDWFYMMPVYELIHNTAIPKARKVLNEAGFDEGRDYRIVRSPFPQAVFPIAKQTLHFISGNRPDKIKSVEYAGGVIDEPGVTKRESIDRINERMRGSGGQIAQILEAGTPEGLNHFSERYDSDTQKGWDRSLARNHSLRRKTEAGEIAVRRFRLTTYDNAHHLPPGYIARLLDQYRNAPAFVQAYILGFFVALLTGGVYSNYKQQKHKCADVNPDPRLDLDLTWDFNHDPLAWVSLQKVAVDDMGRHRIWTAIHEANENAGNLDDACVEFAVKHPVDRFYNTNIRLFGDSSGHAQSHKTRLSDYRAIRKYLLELGYKRVEICAATSNPLETESAGALNDMFLYDQLLLCERCGTTQGGLMSCRWKDGTRKIEKKDGERHTHHPDALKYWAWGVREAEGQQVRSYSR